MNLRCFLAFLAIVSITSTLWAQGQPCIQEPILPSTNCRDQLKLPAVVGEVLCGGECGLYPNPVGPPPKVRKCNTAKDMYQRQANSGIDIDKMYFPIPEYDPRKPAKRATSSGLVDCGKIASCKCTQMGSTYICHVDLSIPVQSVQIRWYGSVGTDPCPVGGDDSL